MAPPSQSVKSPCHKAKRWSALQPVDSGNAFGCVELGLSQSGCRRAGNVVVVPRGHGDFFSLDGDGSDGTINR